ncbi:hypothetical protein [Aliterella atlantica]|uniref:Uncharacterized protein n=1 Tax=Aliterella atlantica CENA595 TaxID=1618023 RepID=A0A0D8ZMM9_9CYAN|nr:hypothetical protein [Aliterella atlantica]KJH69602.1 hypothetical protein UH38_22975 [Aliterella atlantica CENA595]
MDINELTKNLSDRAVASELITWLRQNELLSDNCGNEATDTQLAEIFALHSLEESKILAQIHQLLTASKQSTLTDAIVDTWAAPMFSRMTASAPRKTPKLAAILCCLPQEERSLITVALTYLLQAEGDDFLITEQQVNLAASILCAVGKRSASNI